MKRKYYGKKDVVSVYQFMEMCGLKCEYKKNIRISHEIMMRKLNARKEKFKEAITVPRRANFDIISTETINIGYVIMVRDDYGVVFAYMTPRKLDYPVTYSDEQMEEMRNRIINEPQQQFEYLNGEKLTIGYKKYLLRQEKKRLLEMKEENFVLKKER